MKTATGLALVAIGAILAFAVTGHPAFLNVQVAGWVIMLTGAAGMLVPKRGYGWLRRRVIRTPVRSASVPDADDQRFSPYVMLNPAGQAAVRDPAEQADNGEVVEDYYRD